MKNLIIAAATIAVVASFVLLLICRANGMHPNIPAFCIIAPLLYAYALSRAFMFDKRPAADPSVKVYYDDPLQEEYRLYVFDCMDVQVVPVPFRQWFEATYLSDTYIDSYITK